MQAIPYGTLRISASVLFGVSVLHQWIAEFMRQYSQVNIEVFLTNQYVDMVGKGIDVAVRSGPLSDSSLVTHKLGAVPYWLCASPKYLATHGTPTLPDDLDRHHCLTILSESLSEIMPWTMRRGKDLMEVKPEYHLRMNDFLLVK